MLLLCPTYFEAGEVVGVAQAGDDGAQAVVSAMPALGPQPHCCQGLVQVVTDDQDALVGHLGGGGEGVWRWERGGLTL